MSNNTNLKLLLGKPVYIDNVGYLNSYTLNSILDLGFDVYNYFLNILCITEKDIKKMIIEDDLNKLNDINVFDFLYNICLNNSDSDLKKIILDALSFFFNEKVTVTNYGFQVGDINSKRFITSNNFYKVTRIVKKQNCIKTRDIEEKNFKNDLARQKYEELERIREKMRKMQEDLKNGNKKNKDKDDEKKDISEWDNIISSLCCKHPTINLLNIGELTIYQIIDQFKRTQMIDDYYISIKSLLAGAEKVDVIHWASDIPEESQKEFSTLQEYENFQK